MVDSELLAQVNSSRKLKRSDNEIRKVLLGYGWKKEQIDEALNAPQHPVDMTRKEALPVPHYRLDYPIFPALPVIALIMAFVFPFLGLVLGLVSLTANNRRALSFAAIVISMLFLLAGLFPLMFSYLH